MTPNAVTRFRFPRTMIAVCACALGTTILPTLVPRIGGTTLAARPRAVSLSFDRLWTENARGVEQSVFGPREVVYVLARYSVSGLDTDATVTGAVSAKVQVLKTTGWSTVATYRDAIVSTNGTHKIEREYRSNGAFRNQTLRLVASISLGTVTRTKRIKVHFGPAGEPPTASPAPAHLSFGFDRVLVRNDLNQTTTTIHVNRPMTIVAHYTVQNLQSGHVVGLVRRFYSVWVKGQLRATDTSTDSIIGVNGPNPVNSHTFTPRILGAWRIVVRITLGAISKQRHVDIQVVP
jgi:hypothetical protein